jgi:hypothetical protein
MTAIFAISPVGRPAQVGRPRSCAPAGVSVTARPCQRLQIGGSCIRTRAYPANPGVEAGADVLVTSAPYLAPPCDVAVTVEPV